jgi:hypothetical protein
MYDKMEEMKINLNNMYLYRTAPLLKIKLEKRVVEKRSSVLCVARMWTMVYQCIH